MVYRRLPNSTPQRLAVLLHLSQRVAATPPALVPLTAATIEKLNTFFPQYHQKIKEGKVALYQQASQTARVVPAKKLAMWLVLDFLDAVQNAIRRGFFPPSVRSYYGLPVERRTRPILNTEADIIEQGERVVRGEAERVARGGVPVTFPAIADVAAAVEDFKQKNLQQSNVKDAYDRAQEAIAAENPKADKLILKCWNEIEAAFDEGDKPSLRRKAREWGVVYVERKKKKEEAKTEL
jgi:hypothetical protein